MALGCACFLGDDGIDDNGKVDDDELHLFTAGNVSFLFSSAGSWHVFLIDFISGVFLFSSNLVDAISTCPDQLVLIELNGLIEDFYFDQGFILDMLGFEIKIG
ncbi:hypothetical protein M6B38_386915 [Iris pallida]|uniref:Uncharacterized protein n=1 Tax=Iris pallida TaxID=29817 RepID=A0AAX6G2R0_IRIPA|nr:hypothetical protein M6B38_386915 [Iris pallida]